MFKNFLNNFLVAKKADNLTKGRSMALSIFGSVTFFGLCGLVLGVGLKGNPIGGAIIGAIIGVFFGIGFNYPIFCYYARNILIPLYALLLISALIAGGFFYSGNIKIGNVLMIIIFVITSIKILLRKEDSFRDKIIFIASIGFGYFTIIRMILLYFASFNK